MMICEHCGNRRVTMPRGLCRSCYDTPCIKRLYPCVRLAFRGLGLAAPHSQPALPTSALPGSEAKIRVLEERALRGETLHHPGDAQA